MNDKCEYCQKPHTRYGYNPKIGLEHTCEDHWFRNEKLLEKSGKECCLCDIIFFESSLYEHHISYFPEKTIMLCNSCHKIIHNRNEFKHFVPPKEDAEEFYTKKCKKKRS